MIREGIECPGQLIIIHEKKVKERKKEGKNRKRKEESRRRKEKKRKFMMRTIDQYGDESKVKF